MTDVQDQKAFQKQQPIFLGSKRLLRSSKKSAGLRYWKNVGLGFKTPKDAIEGNYVDKKCPFTGNVSIRGRLMRGVIKSTKMTRTVTLRRDYLHYIPKYNRYEKRHKNFAAHLSPAFRVQQGDQVICGECRPLSKTVRFNVLKVITHASAAKKQFAAY
ncbi:40S small subunit ribosomal protein uS17 (rpS11) [Andalucia godoyi]|uniref:40S small subunit ribosomal protein uS17 (RpS11) n=1 Tax=Andalucia godoyi TaxID=505711 RepID=A0A8K0AIQ3_ANDGO|nr:40S small subunit ribosomal protein uS17 (rpS11) [Andalucia godoyi]WCZ58572.1 60S ribosomal protein L4 [Andalucia godoyi]|eukprot:ANDGO_04482.mRNA.1 40S small subunit ribosomal protein uS17 (rpS11)